MNEVITQDDKFLSIVEKIATNPESDIAKLDKILDMQERIMDKQAKQEFAVALSDMQSAIPVIAEDSKAHQGVRYAKLDAIVSKVRPVLAEFGFSVAFKIDQSQAGLITIEAILTHRNGHSESTAITLPHETSGSKNAVQAIGSTTTYGKRYTICSLLNIATGEDDDANSYQTPVDYITEEQVANIEALITELGRKKEDFAKFMKVPAIAYLPSHLYSVAINKLEMSRAK